MLAASCSKNGDITSPLDANDHSAVNGGNEVNAWRPMDSGTTELLWGVSGSAANEVIAVGTRGTAIHLAADTWLGKATGTGRNLCDVWGSNDGRAIAVGTFGIVLGYDASQWRAVGRRTEQGLYDAWGFETDALAATPALAVLAGVAVGDSGIILGFDGTSWSPMTSGTDVSLFGVWGDTPSNLFAVGVGGTIVHFDGSQWGFMETPTSENISAIWGSSADNIWAVGDAGTVIHFNGTAWTAAANGSATNLYDVWGTAANDVWIVGKSGTILHYNGATWSTVESGTGEDLFGVWGRSADEAYAVGSNGTVLRFGPEPVEQNIFVLHDHPNGGVAPPLYGLRIDDLLGSGHYTFSFDYADQTESARVTLVYAADLAQIHIQGRAYGGRVDGTDWASSSRGWIDIDFIYTTNCSVKDDCGAISGDDFYVTGESVANSGTVTLDGWGGNQSFSFTDRSGENNGCSFIFDNDYDSKGNADIANDLSIWSGSGWLQPAVQGSRDWLFIGRREPATTR